MISISKMEPIVQLDYIAVGANLPLDCAQDVGLDLGTRDVSSHGADHLCSVHSAVVSILHFKHPAKRTIA